MLRDLVAEPDAARAHDAALLVEHDARPDVDALAVVDLVDLEPRRLQVVRHVVDLQLALARLVADRAVDRVVDEQELHHGLAARLHAVGVRLDLHAVGARACCTRSASPRWPSISTQHIRQLPATERSRVVAEVRDVDAGVLRRVDEALARRDLDRLPVQGR